MLMKNEGFTLLELIVTLTIAIILMTVAVPSFSDMLERNRLAGAAEKIKADMEWARTTAIKDNQNIIMTTTLGANNWCYGFNDGVAACDCNDPGACTVDGIVRQYDESPYGGTALGPGAGTLNLTFSPRGILAAAPPGVLTLALNGKTVNISISRLGRSKVCSNSLSHFPGC